MVSLFAIGHPLVPVNAGKCGGDDGMSYAVTVSSQARQRLEFKEALHGFK
jgi:hypothetical protein